MKKKMPAEMKTRRQLLIGDPLDAIRVRPLELDKAHFYRERLGVGGKATPWPLKAMEKTASLARCLGGQV
ncbi:hypothetical protein, partial [uncultured Thiodictyon sp.]|uniref:hypothetical protein n=1 Tax=uncultured Thiodictyon sp. TaxID=1846217 RepID=UPI0025D7AC96